MTGEDVLAEVKQSLCAHGQRLTSLRADLIKVFMKERRPLTVQEVVSLAPRRLPLSSVYRNLTSLHAVGVLVRLNFDEGYVRYELANDFIGHHHHLICEQCQVVVDLAENTLTEVETAVVVIADRVLQDYGFVVRSHQIELKGVCARCLSS